MRTLFARRAEERILVLLEKPHTCRQLMTKTGLKAGAVYSALQRLMVMNKVSEVGLVPNYFAGVWGRSLKLYQAVTKRAETYTGSRAGPITIPQFRWGSTRLG